MKESWQEALVEKLAEKLVALDTMDGSTEDFLERSKGILREMSNRTLEKAAEERQILREELTAMRKEQKARLERKVHEALYEYALEDLLRQLAPYAPTHKRVGCMGPRICPEPCLRCQVEQVLRKIDNSPAALRQLMDPGNERE